MTNGIIPACAGSTHYVDYSEFPNRDHPRMCGEHQANHWTRLTLEGSSPHVRGARGEVLSLHGRHGIIPACAGSTIVAVSLRIRARDHPRMCGEHGSRMHLLIAMMGSSPHVRGAPNGQPNHALAAGIIPACAGSTYSTVNVHVAEWDHPRMCGEHGCAVCVNGCHWGSSPHVRGALIEPEYLASLDGIIPACAGSTLRK